MYRDDPLPRPDAETAREAAESACSRSVTDIDPISDGVNAIYDVTFADNTRAILKVPTFNTTDELRPEPQLLRLVGRETAIPVPDVLSTIEDGPLGMYHYLLQYCDGQQVRQLDELSPERQEQLVEEAATYLAQLHELSVPEACGPLRVASEANADSPFGTAGTASWGSVFASLASHQVDLFEEVQSRDGRGRLADLVPDITAAFENVATDIASPETPRLLHMDFHLANFILTEGGAESTIQAVLDFGAPYLGDYRFDVAYAEDAIINVQYPLSGRAETLRELFRSTYADERDLDRKRVVDRRYAYYLLLQRVRWMAVVVNFDECDDPEGVEQAYRSFVDQQLATIGVR